MIKNFENFVNDSETINEGFIDNILAGLESGISGYRAKRRANDEVDKETMNILRGESEVSVTTQLAVLVSKLIRRSAMFADRFSEGKVINNLDLSIADVEMLEEMLAKIKELLPQYCEEQNRY
jgi:hypothetical protein